MTKRKIKKLLEKCYYRKLRKNIPNEDVTIISHDCTAGIIYHQLGRRFLSPFINTLIYSSDFFKLANNLKEYMACELIEDIENDKNYPVGILRIDDTNKIKIHFLHDKTFLAARKKFEERKKRINYDRVIFVYNLTNLNKKEEILKYSLQFNELRELNKIILINADLKIENAVFIDMSSIPDSKQIISAVNLHTPWKKYIDAIDYSIFFKK